VTLTLTQITFLIGGLLAALNTFALLAPERARAALLAFPRDVWSARVISAVDLIWVTWMVSHASLGRFEFLKPYIWILGIAAFVAINVLMDELLAPRALGGLLTLIANPVMAEARWADSPWRLVIIILMYSWVIAGIILLLSPFRFRKWFAYFLANDIRYHAACIGGILLGILLLAIGAWAI